MVFSHKSNYFFHIVSTYATNNLEQVQCKNYTTLPSRIRYQIIISACICFLYKMSKNLLIIPHHSSTKLAKLSTQVQVKMQYGFGQTHQRYPHYRSTRQPREFYYPPPPTTNYYPTHNLGYPSAYYPPGANSNFYYYNPFPMGQHTYNSGGNWYDGNGIQRNGDVKLNNGNAKRKNRKTTVIGGCHGNQGGHQVTGDVILGDIH